MPLWGLPLWGLPLSTNDNENTGERMPPLHFTVQTVHKRYPLMEPVFIYLLHFDEPLAHATHYIGATNHLKSRLQRHAHGRSSKILAALRRNNIEWRLAALWIVREGTPCWAIEQQAKRQKNGPRFCPICTDKPQRMKSANYPLVKYPVGELTFPTTSKELRRWNF